jgi:hypothetical protein
VVLVEGKIKRIENPEIGAHKYVPLNFDNSMGKIAF